MFNRHLGYLISGALALLCATGAMGEQATTCTVAVRPAACLQAADSITTCAAALQDDPSDVSARLALCQAHLAKEELVEATVVLRRGAEICGSGAACTNLRVALSNVQELSGRQSSDKQAERDVQARVDRGYCLGPSSNDAALKACKSVLAIRADDPAVYQALATKLLARRRPGEAVAALQGALRVGGDKAKLTPLVQDAQKQRAALSKTCVTGNIVADCDDALLAGESDEITIQLRRGDLLRKMGRNTAALQAYIAAQSRDPKNQNAARKVLDLVGGELRITPKEPNLLAAQGDGYYTLGDLNSAIRSYKDAFKFGLADDAVRARMAAAREARATKVERECLQATSEAACNALLLAGESDEPKIRSHIASLGSDKVPAVIGTPGDSIPEETGVQRETTIQVVDSKPPPATISAEDTRDSETPPPSNTQVAVSTVEQRPDEKTKMLPDEPLVTALYTNAASIGGTTH